MLKLFKSTMIMYWMSAIIGGGFIIFVFINSNPPLIVKILGWLFLVLWCLFFATISQLIANKKMNKIIEKISNDCSYQEAIVIFNGLLEKRKNKIIQTYLLLNLSTFYMYIGDNETASQSLAKATYFPNKRNGARFKVLYYNNLCYYYLQINDIQNAAKALEDMKTAAQNSKLTKPDHDMFLKPYTGKQFLINIANGNYDGAEQYFSISYDIEKQTIGKVAAKFSLGEIYLHYERLPEAKEAFEYVADNGGDTFYVDKAKDYLGQLQG